MGPQAIRKPGYVNIRESTAKVSSSSENGDKSMDE
jgi:hypothetical protein